MADAKQFIPHASEIRRREQSFSHPWNPKSRLIGVQLSRALGLKRTAVSIARMPPGKESFVYHSHHHEEEWLYILSGRGIAEIDVKSWKSVPAISWPFPLLRWPIIFKQAFKKKNQCEFLLQVSWHDDCQTPSVDRINLTDAKTL